MGDSIPGFRFFPTEEELISFYLKRKLELEGTKDEILDSVIPQLNIYDYTPQDLQQHAGVKCRGDPEQCFFFIPRQESETRGGRPSRLTETGYWKATGSPSNVYSSDNRAIGWKRTMVFYTGRAPQGSKTLWKMNEYLAIQGDNSASSSSSPITARRHEFSLCRIYKKTKCIRAFDRRPLGVEMYRQVDSHQQNLLQQQLSYYFDHNQDHDATTMSNTTHHQIITAAVTATPLESVIEKTSSLDGSISSSSLDGPAQASENGQYLAAEDDDWIDWDML